MIDLRDKDHSRVYQTTLTKIEAQPANQITKDFIINSINESLIFLGIKDYKYTDVIAAEIMSAFSVKSSLTSIITEGNDHIDWYDPSRYRPYWETYRDFLKYDEKYPLETINSIDITTDLILQNVEDPSRPGPWDNRGLVVGSVQSGKTSNFIGLINKAVDAGYKIIIILSGLHKNLRQQTQKRIDKGFLGYDTQASKRGSQIYAGPLFKRRQHFKKPPISCFTTSDINGDFSTRVAHNTNVHVKEPTILVIKKNKTVLQNVIKYFVTAPDVAGVIVDPPFKLRQMHGGKPPFIRDIPILVIDDEVDSGSVDTGEQYLNVETNEFDPEYDPKTINRLIRQLLHIFEKKVFIGYTATPFANIFIHDRAKTDDHGLDLFPKDFIVDLPIPSNHYGLESLFSKNSIDESIDHEIEENIFFNVIDDYCINSLDDYCNEGWIPPSHNKEHIPIYNNSDELPPSFKEAIVSFILSCSCRNWRGHINQHKSMLVHVSKFQKVQQKVQDQVINYLDNLRKFFLDKNTEAYNVNLNFFKDIWEKNFLAYKEKFKDKTYPTWQQLIDNEKSINFVISELVKNIKLLNGESNDELNYEDHINKWNFGLHTIVIGGDKLSRGLTLEGLSMSYFLRSAKMPMYDTLMQMGRWFGYREGYDDLCRLYTSRNTIEWFYHICEATVELRNEFKIMSARSPKATPKEFGLRIKSHPTMLITAKTKMRHSSIEKTSFSEHYLHTITFSREEKIIQENFSRTEHLFKNIGNPKISGKINKVGTNWNWLNSYLWENVPSTAIIEYLKSYQRYLDTRSYSTNYFAEYIKKLNKYDELNNFTVVLFGNGNSNQNVKIANKFDVDLLSRVPTKNYDSKKISFKTIAGSKDEAIDLTQEEFEKYEEFCKIKKAAEGKEYVRDNVDRLVVRQYRSPKRGLLNIYPIYGIKNYSAYQKYSQGNIITPADITSKPLIAIYLSLPRTNLSTEQASIEYRVNTIYAEQERINNLI